MPLWHMHQWGEPTATFAPRNQHLERVQTANDQMLREVLYGVSTVTQRCEVCGKARSYTVAGDARRATPSESTEGQK